MSILALHGFTGCGADFEPLAHELGGKWHCPALPGHGPKPQLDCSPQATLECINQELTHHHLTITKQKILLGYSMCARAALLHATDHPEAWDALILISGNPGIKDETDRANRRIADAELADSIERIGMQAFLEFWQETPLIRSQKKIPADLAISMQANRLKNTSSGLAKSLCQFGQGSMANLWPKLDKLAMPLLLITGERDKKYTNIAQRMRTVLPQACHVTIQDASHMPHLEQADPVIEAMHAFMAEL